MLLALLSVALSTLESFTKHLVRLVSDFVEISASLSLCLKYTLMD